MHFREKIKKPSTCWQFWYCVRAKRERCLIYKKKYGRRCWFLAMGSPQAKREFQHCWECPWYLESNNGRKRHPDLSQTGYSCR